MLKFHGGQLSPANEEAAEALEKFKNGEQYEVEIKLTPIESRTSQQNRALHLYCDRVATSLNDAGLDMEKTLKHGTAVPWSKNTVKELIWSVVQEAMTGEAATSKQKRDAYGQVYEVVNNHLGSKFGIHVAWPSV